MSDLFLLSEDQMAQMSPYFPLSHGVARVDDRRVISGIVYVIKLARAHFDLIESDRRSNPLFAARFLSENRFTLFGKRSKENYPSMTKLFADGGYTGEKTS